MAVIRVEKTDNYTVMSNSHFREREMSLRAKGLLSLMLSLPDSWDYSVSGLCAICKESETAIKRTLKELKEYGYLKIKKLMPNETGSGRIEYEYTIFEHPQKTRGQKQEVEKQGVEVQAVEKQEVENHGQLNTNLSITDLSSNNYQSINHNMPIDRSIDATVIDDIKYQLSYDMLRCEFDADLLDIAVSCVAEMYCTSTEMKFNGLTYSPEYIHERSMEINHMHIEYVFDCFREQREKVYNVKNYLRTAIFNAVDTMGAYYENKVRADGLVI